MTDDKKARGCENLAKTYRTFTGAPIVVGSAFMKSCRDIGMDTRDLLEVRTLSQ